MVVDFKMLPRPVSLSYMENDCILQRNSAVEGQVFVLLALNLL